MMDMTPYMNENLIIIFQTKLHLKKYNSNDLKGGGKKEEKNCEGVDFIYKLNKRLGLVIHKHNEFFWWRGNLLSLLGYVYSI